MERSPGGHEIRRIQGTAAEIESRGREMAALGAEMRESAALLRSIVDGARGKGYSIDDLKDDVGDLHVDLGRAGERYEPSGRVLERYGSTLGEVQPTVDGIVDECTELWARYEAARDAHAGAIEGSAPVDATPEEAAARDEQLEGLRSDRDRAYAAWAEEARRYDAPYETWDAAYDAALRGLEDANDRGVTDSFWDDALPVIEAISTVLAVAGVILAVLAIVVGGPLIALLGAIVGLAALATTIWKAARGRGGTTDVVMAVIGIVPFGRLAKLGQFGEGWSGAGRFLGGFGSDLVGLTPFREVRAMRGVVDVLRGPVVNSAGNLTQSRGILQRMSAFADDMAALRYSGPSGWMARIGGGTGGQLAEGISEAYGSAGPAAANRLDDALRGTVLDGVQHGSSGLDVALNFVDAVPKPLYGAYELGSQAWDALTDPVDGWSRELAGAK